MMYESLTRQCQTFMLYILAMDDGVSSYFKSNHHNNVEIETIDDLSVIYPQLKKIRLERTEGEFCWTLSSFVIQYTIMHFKLDHCIYIDSDLFFYNDPNIALNKIEKKSVLITEHNYTPEYDQSKESGKYCVQFMYFRNDKKGMEVLEWWRQKCEEWCYNRVEDGKFGDQKYLDDWESRFGDCVYTCIDMGCGLAPWNCQKYELKEEDGTFWIIDRITKKRFLLIFYHFHGLLRLKDQRWIMSGYRLNDSIKELYMEYINGLENIESGLSSKYAMRSVDNPFIYKHKMLHSIKQGVKSFYHSYFDKPIYVDNLYKTP